MSTDTAAKLKLRVFISSVQKELEEERMQLRILLTSDPFLLRYTVTPQRPVNRNHPIIIRFPGPNHPISASPRLIARHESTDNRPIIRRQSSDAAAKIVRDRQAKRLNRQGPRMST